jgi:excisionase family DNA binding protein
MEWVQPQIGRLLSRLRTNSFFRLEKFRSHQTGVRKTSSTSGDPLEVRRSPDVNLTTVMIVHNMVNLKHMKLSNPELQAPDVCTTREAADLLGVSLRTIQQWVEQGALRAYRTVGGHRRVLRSSVEAMLLGRQQAVSDRTYRVLVVEDDPELLTMYRLALEGWGLPLEVITANDGIRAVVEIGKYRPDFLLLDLQMPRMDGFNVIRTLRNMPDFEDIEIIVITGLAPELLVRHAQALLGVLVINKPASLEVVRDRIVSRIGVRLGLAR